MKVLVEYTDEVGTSFDADFFTRVAKETLLRCPLPNLSHREEITLNTVAVSSEKIQELNATYRGKEAVTDILSFGEYPDTQTLEAASEQKLFLGELFFCQDFIAASAEEDNIALEHEMVYVFSHGVLHLLGYDHSDEMFVLQDEVTALLTQEAHTHTV